MVKQRFQPISAEIGGYLKTFGIIWLILFILILIVGGFNKWSFYAAIGLGFLLTIPIYGLALYLTGVRANNEKRDKK